MEITKAFSLRINELIDETGLSLENLSRAAGVSVFTLFHLKGQNNPKLPSTKVLLKLADYFKCSLSFMLAVFYAGTGGMQFSAVAQNRAAGIF